VESRELVLENLKQSAQRVLARVEDMREHALVFPTPRGGCHTLWILGHLAFIEGQVIHEFMRGEPNPLADWEPIFDGPEPSGDPRDYPPFDAVLATCREIRQSTVALLEQLTEDELDAPGAKVPPGWEASFGTVRRCLQFVADHWFMHRGQLADARRAAGLSRHWV